MNLGLSSTPTFIHLPLPKSTLKELRQIITSAQHTPIKELAQASHSYLPKVGRKTKYS